MKTIYVGQVDETTHKIWFKEQQVNSFQDDFQTNCTEFIHACMTSYDGALEAEQGYNDDLASGKLFLKKCKDCGLYFFTSENEENWFKERSLKSPLRCMKCRKKRKAG